MDDRTPAFTLGSNSYFEGIIQSTPEDSHSSLIEVSNRIGERWTELEIQATEEICNKAERMAKEADVNRRSLLVRALKSAFNLYREEYPSKIHAAVTKACGSFLYRNPYPKSAQDIGGVLFCKRDYRLLFVPQNATEHTKSIAIASYVDRDPDAGVPMQDAPDINIPIFRDVIGTLHIFNLEFYQATKE